MNLILIILVIAVALYFLNGGNLEGYDSVTGHHNTESKGNLDDYYLWRAYGHDAYNQCRLGGYPYNYQPKSHPKRYTYYNPYFYNYGYGHL